MIKNNRLLFGIFITFSVIIPSIYIIIAEQQNFIASILTILNQILVAIFLIAAYLFTYKHFNSKLILKSIPIISSTYYLIISFIIFYWSYTGNRPDLFFFLDSSSEILSTSINMFNIKLIFSIIIFYPYGYHIISYTSTLSDSPGSILDTKGFQ